MNETSENPTPNSSSSTTKLHSDSGTNPPPKLRWYRSSKFPIFAIVVLGLGLLWAQFFFDPIQGDALVNLISFAMSALLGMILAFWFTFLSFYSRRTVLTIMIPLLLIGVGWAASIRSVEFDGDMKANFVYRWEPPPVLQQAQASPAQEAVGIYEESPTDFPAYRGRNFDGILVSPPLNKDWQAKPPRELWRTDVGEGYASMSVVGNSLITLEQRENQEAVTCYDTTTGQLKWIHAYPARFYEAMGGLGPRTTPTISEGRVYVAGAAGDATCLDFFTGKVIWSRNLLQDLNIPNVIWGQSSSPLVLEDKVIFNPGAPDGDGLMALDPDTGKTIWQAAGLSKYTEENKSNHCGYSSPIVMNIHDVEQLIIFEGKGLRSCDIQTGETLWHYPFENGADVNSAQPVLLDDGHHIFISASYAMGSAVVDVQKTTQTNAEGVEKISWTVEKVWHEERTLRSKFTSVIYRDDYIYGLDEGIMMCIEPLTGKKQWKAGRFGHGQLVYADGTILVMAEDGNLHMIEPNPTEFRELTSMMVLPNSSKVWNPQALADGIVYVRDHRQMAAFDIRKTEPVPAP